MIIKIQFIILSTEFTQSIRVFFVQVQECARTVGATEKNYANVS